MKWKFRKTHRMLCPPLFACCTSILKFWQIFFFSLPPFAPPVPIHWSVCTFYSLPPPCRVAVAGIGEEDDLYVLLLLHFPLLSYSMSEYQVDGELGEIHLRGELVNVTSSRKKYGGKLMDGRHFGQRKVPEKGGNRLFKSPSSFAAISYFHIINISRPYYVETIIIMIKAARERYEGNPKGRHLFPRLHRSVSQKHSTTFCPSSSGKNAKNISWNTHTFSVIFFKKIPTTFLFSAHLVRPLGLLDAVVHRRLQTL